MARGMGVEKSGLTPPSRLTSRNSRPASDAIGLSEPSTGIALSSGSGQWAS